jgi:hypothetical protein
MKTLRQVIEGTVVSADFKMSKSGRKYKAHRREMGKPTALEIAKAMKKGPMADQMEGTMRGGKYVDDAPRPGTNEVPVPDEGYRPPKSKKKPQTTKLVDDGEDDVVKEAKDPREYDYEGDMAKSQLRSIIANAKQVHDKLEDDTNMAEWVQSKITKAADYISTVADYMQSEVKEEVEQVDEISKGSIEKYMNSAVPDYGHQNLISRVGKGSDKEEATRKLANRSKGITRAVSKTTEKNMKEDQDLDEARGRPAGAATLAKRAAAAKPRDDDDDGDHYDADSGVEADQHIHVQLKKAVDSTMKPYEVSFKNGKKHAVSSHVAKNLLDATERLKPEHRKNVHDEIHKSYDNLLAVHKMIVGK